MKVRILPPTPLESEFSDQDHKCNKDHGNNLEMFLFPPLCQHPWSYLHWVLYMVLFFRLLFDTIYKAICVLKWRVLKSLSC